jgi:hypothetical protein
MNDQEFEAYLKQVREYSAYRLDRQDGTLIKVGVTCHSNRRKYDNEQYYGSDVVLTVLEEFTGDAYLAETKEMEWQQKLGAKRSISYTQTLKSSGYVNFTSEEQSVYGSIGAIAADLGHASPEDREKYGIGFENNDWYIGSDKHKADAARGAAIAAENGTTGFQSGAAGRASGKIIRTCPHCGTTGKGPTMGKWHFDNCKKNPNRKQHKPKDSLFNL